MDELLLWNSTVTSLLSSVDEKPHKSLFTAYFLMASFAYLDADLTLTSCQMLVFLEIEHVFAWGWSLVSKTLAENMRRPGFGSSSALHKTGHGGTWL